MRVILPNDEIHDIGLLCFGKLAEKSRKDEFSQPVPITRLLISKMNNAAYRRKVFQQEKAGE